MRGLEPPRLTAIGPKPIVYTISPHPQKLRSQGLANLRASS